MRLTNKGQITVPKRFRERLGITPETDLEMRVEGEKLVVRKAKPSAPVQAIRGSVRKLPFGRDVEEYLAGTRGRR